MLNALGFGAISLCKAEMGSNPAVTCVKKARIRNELRKLHACYELCSLIHYLPYVHHELLRAVANSTYALTYDPLFHLCPRELLFTSVPPPNESYIVVRILQIRANKRINNPHLASAIPLRIQPRSFQNALVDNG
jgi:hypothetical protein